MSTREAPQRLQRQRGLTGGTSPRPPAISVFEVRIPLVAAGPAREHHPDVTRLQR
jgi:hypothetical protein